MKLQALELPFGIITHTPKLIALLLTITLLVLTTISFHYPSFLLKSTTVLSSPTRYIQTSETVAVKVKDSSIVTAASVKKCDIFSGEWVWNPRAPYYTNNTCWAIHEHQNCQKYGRPDSDYMKWRWKPDGCDLPIFNPAQFLEMVRDKSLAFVGDSVGRNQMQSLICLLSRVAYPIDASYTSDENFKRWKYTSYNFTMATFWTPHLIKSKESDSKGPTSTGLFSLYLDEFDEKWTTQIDEFNYIIISAGHWFYRPTVFYENNRVVGCHYCLLENVTDLTMYYGYRKAFRTAFKAINSLKNYKGITFLRTFAPSHFEGGLWNKGGNCLRTRPFKSNETWLEGETMEFYMAQIEEYKIAEREGKKRGLKFRLLDTTQAMLMRPDGHPSRYGHWAHENVTLYNDCVHWCLPGPIDNWSDFLLEMLKMEGGRSRQENMMRHSRNI